LRCFGRPIISIIQAWTLSLDPSFGYYSALSVGPSVHSLMAGTSRGFLTVWDLRFHINLQVYRAAGLLRWRNDLKLSSALRTSLTVPRFELIFQSIDQVSCVHRALFSCGAITHVRESLISLR
jgi:hypothetical protein